MLQPLLSAVRMPLKPHQTLQDQIVFLQTSDQQLLLKLLYQLPALSAHIFFPLSSPHYEFLLFYAQLHYTLLTSFYSSSVVHHVLQPTDLTA